MINKAGEKAKSMLAGKKFFRVNLIGTGCISTSLLATSKQGVSIVKFYL